MHFTAPMEGCALMGVPLLRKFWRERQALSIAARIGLNVDRHDRL